MKRPVARIVASAVLAAVVMLGTMGTMAASAATTSAIGEMTIKSFSVVESPSTKPRLLVLNFKAVQVTDGAEGKIFLYDFARNVVLLGSVTALTGIVDGYRFEGCGLAFGSVSGYVCFQGAGQARPGGADYDLFSLFISSGGSYSVSGQLPPGSIDED